MSPFRVAVDSREVVPHHPRGLSRPPRRGEWVLRWNSATDERPRLLPGGPDGSVPTAVFEAASGSMVLFDGYLFDGAASPDDVRLSEGARVAQSYDRWGEGFLDRLRGGYALAVWDREQKRLVAGRDAMGLHPCFYWWDGRLFLLSSSLDAILAQPEVGRTFNRVVIAEYLLDACSSHQVGETFYQEIRRLPPAHALYLTAGSLTISRYWDPVPPGFAWADETGAARLEPFLERAVGRCLAVGADSISLSGGFDSVGIATLAAEQRRDRRPLHAVSLRFAGDVCDEGETQLAVARALGMPQLMRSIAENLDGAALGDVMLSLSATSPNPMLSLWQAKYLGLFRTSADLGLSRMMIGTGGDELLTVGPAYGADCLAALDLAGLWRLYRAWQRASGGSAMRVARTILWEGALKRESRQLARRLLRRVSPRGLDWLRARRRRHRMEAWAMPPDRALAAELEHRQFQPDPLPLAPGEREYVKVLRGLTQAPLLLHGHDEGHAWGRRLGITFLYPYLDRDLVELALRTHPASLIAGGWAKAPLRRLVGERLPGVRMPTSKVVFTRMAHRVLRTEGHAAWRGLGGPERLAELGVVDADGLKPAMEDYFAGRSKNLLRTWAVLSTEIWLRAQSGESCGLRDRRV